MGGGGGPGHLPLSVGQSQRPGGRDMIHEITFPAFCDRENTIQAETVVFIYKSTHTDTRTHTKSHTHPPRNHTHRNTLSRSPTEREGVQKC